MGLPTAEPRSEGVAVAEAEAQLHLGDETVLPDRQTQDPQGVAGRHLCTYAHASKVQAGDRHGDDGSDRRVETKPRVGPRDVLVIGRQDADPRHLQRRLHGQSLDTEEAGALLGLAGLLAEKARDIVVTRPQLAEADKAPESISVGLPLTQRETLEADVFLDRADGLFEG